MSYYPDATRANSFECGLEFQDFVCLALQRDGIVLQNFGSKLYQCRVGENLQGFEIKLDERCTDTGRLSIEVAEKSRRDVDQWTPSGIMRGDNTWLYIQGNRSVLYIFARNWLVRYYREKNPQVLEFNGTIKRFFLPFKVADAAACKVMRFPAIDAQLGLDFQEPDVQQQSAFAASF